MGSVFRPTPRICGVGDVLYVLSYVRADRNKERTFLVSSWTKTKNMLGTFNLEPLLEAQCLHEFFSSHEIGLIELFFYYRRRTYKELQKSFKDTEATE